jgi:DNA polymerase III subunit gamma/tau
MSQAYYRKWRPQKWEEVVGQDHIVQTLKNAVSGDRVAHAYLFAGPRGTGKTTAARLLAKAVNCLDESPAKRPCNTCEHCKAVNEGRYLDLIEIDAASQTGVDGVRDLRDKINFMPNQGKYKVYIIDEVHMFSTPAFNALLKTLEEPPPHAIFILATTEINKIPATVLSRCQRHEFRRLPLEDIVNQLKHIVKTEKLEAEPEALTLIARLSAGGMRDAISLLDQLASGGSSISLQRAQEVLGTATSQTVIELIQAVVESKSAAGMEAIHTTLDGGADPRQLARQVVDYLRALLLLQMGNVSAVDLSAEVRQQAKEHAAAFSSAEILRMVRAFNAAATDQRGGWQPSLPLELALAEVIGVRNSPAEASVPAASNQPASQAPMRKEAAPTIKETSASQTAPVEEADLTLNTLAKSWKQVAVALSEEKNLAAVINSCRPLELKNNTVTIGFQSDIVLGMATQPEKTAAIIAALAKVFGVELKIKCIVSNAKQAIPPDVKADGMVAAALKAGGEIVDIQE